MMAVSCPRLGMSPAISVDGTMHQGLQMMDIRALGYIVLQNSLRSRLIKFSRVITKDKDLQFGTAGKDIPTTGGVSSLLSSFRIHPMGSNKSASLASFSAFDSLDDRDHLREYHRQREMPYHVLPLYRRMSRVQISWGGHGPQSDGVNIKCKWSGRLEHGREYNYCQIYQNGKEVMSIGESIIQK